MQGNEYHDVKGHFTDKQNDGGACHHLGFDEANEVFKRTDLDAKAKQAKLEEMGYHTFSEQKKYGGSNKFVVIEEENPSLDTFKGKLSDYDDANYSNRVIKTKLNLENGNLSYCVGEKGNNDRKDTNWYSDKQSAIKEWNRKVDNRKYEEESFIKYAEYERLRKEKEANEWLESINSMQDDETKKEAIPLFNLMEKLRKGEISQEEYKKTIKDMGYKLNPYSNEVFGKNVDVEGLPFKPLQEIVFGYDFGTKKHIVFPRISTKYYFGNGKYLSKEPKSEFDSVQELKDYHSKVKSEIESGEAKYNTYKNASDEEKAKMMRQKDFDPRLYLSDDRITSGVRIGGYSGHSQSNSAVASKEEGSMPLSRWNKKTMKEFIENSDYADEMKPYMPLLSKIPMKDLKDIVLYEDGWHHTGKFYNKTDFYGIDSPRNIVDRLRDYISFHEGIKKGLGV